MPRPCAPRFSSKSRAARIPRRSRPASATFSALPTAGVKPFAACFGCLSSGDLPLCFQFSGTVFYQDQDGALQVSPISWDKEARFRLPLKVWKALMDEHYPNSVWLAIGRDTFDRLYEFKVREGIPTWDQAIERALASVRETVRS